MAGLATYDCQLMAGGTVVIVSTVAQHNSAQKNRGTLRHGFSALLQIALCEKSK